jgi:uncharacterized caspase-like protein
MRALFKYAISVALALAIGLSAGSVARADRKVALVIGNGTYQNAGILHSAVNDANAVADLLSRAGFDVVERRSDLGVFDFWRALLEFSDSAANADIAVVYFSGHGLNIGGVDYLIPVDANLSSALNRMDEAVSLDWVLSATSGDSKLSLIILDACRESPFRPASEGPPAARVVSSGLAGVTPPNGHTLIALAAKAGSVSYDGDGPNSPFASALVRYIAQPGLDIRIALGKVHDEVLQATGARQEPSVYGSLPGEDIALVAAEPGVADRTTVEVSKGAPGEVKGASEDVRSAPPSPGMAVAPLTPTNPDATLAPAATANETASTATEVSNGVSSDTKAASEDVRPAPPSPGTPVAS